MKYPGLRPWFYSHLLNRIMLRIVEAIIGLELCEQSCTERAAQCQEKIHASEAARSAAERAPPPSEILKIRPWTNYTFKPDIGTNIIVYDLQ